MNKLTVIAIIAIVIISAVLVFPYLPEDWRDLIDPNNPNIDAEYKQSLLVMYVDGSSSLVENSAEPLSAYREDKEINTIYHILEARLVDGIDSITIRGIDIVSFMEVWTDENNKHGDFIKSSEANSEFAEVILHKGESWIELARTAVNTQSLTHNLPPEKHSFLVDFSFKSMTNADGFIEYEYKDSWEQADFPGKITIGFRVG